MKDEIEDTIQRLKTGRLTMPPEVDDPATFIVSGGRITSKAKPGEKPTTVGEAVTAYFSSIPEGSKATSSLNTERIHLAHFERLLKSSTPLMSVRVADLQDYVNSRLTEGGIRGRKVQPATLKKELASIGQLWRFAAKRGWAKGDFPRGDIRLPKPAAKQPFRTWEEIETIVEQGGLDEAEIRDLWDCLFLREAEVLEFLDFVKEKGSAPWVYPIVTIAAYTGSRRSEILRSEVPGLRLRAEHRHNPGAKTRSRSGQRLLPPR